MPTIKPLYGTNNQAIACTLNGLAPSAVAGRCSVALDNTANLYLDVLVFAKAVKTIVGTLGGSKTVYLWVYGTADGGATYTDSMPGTDTAATRTDPPILRFLGAISVAAAATPYPAGPFSVALAFGGILPDHWGIFVGNDTGLALDGSAGGTLIYQGIQAQSV